MEEFALCWKNFQDNISDGFNGLFMRGDLVDVTLACDGKLLQAHKIVLAICSPYFQEMFLTNPCKHPILILKDVSYEVMTALLQFMYQGVVNVKHSELPIFMKIAASLQIKGLTAHEENNKYADTQQSKEGASTASPMNSTSATSSTTKRSQEVLHEPYSIMPKRRQHQAPPSSQRMMAELLHHVQAQQQQHLRVQVDAETSNSESIEGGENGNNGPGPEDVLIPAISMTESSRYEVGHVKREAGDQLTGISGENSHGTNGNPSPSNGERNSSFSGPLKMEFSSGGASSAADIHGTLAAHHQMLANRGEGISPSAHFKFETSQSELNSSTEQFSKSSLNHMEIPTVTPGEKWLQGKLEFMLSQRGKPLLVHDGHTFGIQYVRKDKKYWQCNLSRKFNCKARVTTTESGDIIVTNNEHCHTEIRQHLRKDYKLNRMHALSLNLREMQERQNQEAALQMNLERLRAVAQQQHQQSLAVVAAMNLNNSNSHDNNNNNNNNGNSPSSLDREVIKGGIASGESSLITDQGNNTNNNNGDLKHDDPPMTVDQSPKKFLDWKEELLRNHALREDLK